MILFTKILSKRLWTCLLSKSYLWVAQYKVRAQIQRENGKLLIYSEQLLHETKVKMKKLCCFLFLSKKVDTGLQQVHVLEH